jgi:type IV pilus assembly protein PilY1
VLQVVGDRRIASDHAIDWTQHRGWSLEFPTAGERVVTRPILRNERLIVTTFIPTGELCHASGTGWLMEFDAITGSRLPFPPFDRNGDGHVDAADLIDATLSGEAQRVAKRSR